MKNVLKYLLLALIAVSQLFACGGSDDEKTPADNFDVQFTVPGSVDVTEGGECTFAVSGGGKSPLTTDTFILESDAGISYVCPIVNTSSDSFTVRLADGCETGYYKVFVKRDARKKSFGRIYINIVEDIDFKPDAGTTVYGIVSSAGVGVENVVVSDGAEVTVTNEKGIYQLKSAKKWGYVFISVPSGYEVPSVGVLPQFHRALKNSADVVERADFKLEKVDGQDSYKIFMLGDMHLANRMGDLGQFAQFTSDLTDYMTRHKGEKMYALTLGDMTWDLYWYSNSYYFPQYLNTVNSQIKNLQIFHTMIAAATTGALPATMSRASPPSSWTGWRKTCRTWTRRPPSSLPCMRRYSIRPHRDSRSTMIRSTPSGFSTSSTDIRSVS